MLTADRQQQLTLTARAVTTEDDSCGNQRRH